MISRHTFIIIAVGGLLGRSRSARAQQTGKIARVGILLTGSPSNPQPTRELDAFTKELRQLGWVEGQNLAVERRWAETPDSFPGLAADLVRENVNVILTPGPAATRAAKEATSTVPIVMIGSTDPTQVGAGSLARPGGNLTGLTIGQPELIEKRLELLKETIPRLSRVVVLWDVLRTESRGEQLKRMAAAATKLGLRLQHLEVNNPLDFERAFKAAKKERAGALLLIESPRAVAHRTLVAELGLTNRLPVMSTFSAMVQAGVLMSYGTDLIELWRRAATYVDRVLKGVKPADLPIEQPTKLELVINLKTAKALGLTIPPSVLLRADEVIQ